MPELDPIKPTEIADLIRIACQYGLSDIGVQQGEIRIEMRIAVDSMVPAGATDLAGEPADESMDIPSDVFEIVSPVTGVYYVAPSPADSPYIHFGEIVNEGDPIGLIEAMKVFSEVLADRTGRVRRILVSNGQLVQQGDPIVELSPVDPAEL